MLQITREEFREEKVYAAYTDGAGTHEADTPRMGVAVKPCSRCGHSWAEHAGDVSHPDTLPCFHGAATGEGCHEIYANRCPNYVHPEGTH